MLTGTSESRRYEPHACASRKDCLKVSQALRPFLRLAARARRWYDAGGWERYAQAHRKHLAAMFASKLGLPADVLSIVVDFWGAHVGMYAFDAGATKAVEKVENGRKSGPCTIS